MGAPRTTNCGGHASLFGSEHEAAWLVQWQIGGGQLLRRAPTDQCHSLLPPGGLLCQGLRARPLLEAREEMAL